MRQLDALNIQIFISIHIIFMSSKEGTHLLLHGNLHFSIYVQKEEFGYLQNGIFFNREKPHRAVLL